MILKETLILTIRYDEPSRRTVSHVWDVQVVFVVSEVCTIYW